MLEFSHLDSLCFEWFLQAFAQMYPHQLHLIQLDNAKAHNAQTLTVPENVVSSVSASLLPGTQSN